MGTLGCLFCEKTGTPGNVNQHLRTFLDSSRTNRTSRQAAHHNLELIEAFYHLTTTPQPDLVAATSVDRLAVLTAFASRLTKRLTSDAAAEAWRERDYYPRRGTWWGAQVNTVLAMYEAAGRIPELLAAHVSNVVEMSITDSLRHRDPDPAANRMPAPPQPRIARSQVVANSAASASTTPGPRTDMTMQYSGSIHAADIAFENPRRMWTNSIGDRSRHEPLPRSVHRQRESDLTYVTISDDDDGPPPPPIAVSKRTAASTGLRAASFAAPTAYTAPLPGSRSVSDSAIPRAPAASATDDADDDGMAPFLSLHVRGLTNKVAQIPIAYGTTLAAALQLAVALAPAHVRQHEVPVAFEGDSGSVWEGEWPEWRWEQVMQDAETRRVVLEVRLVMV